MKVFKFIIGSLLILIIAGIIYIFLSGGEMGNASLLSVSDTGHDTATADLQHTKIIKVLTSVRGIVIDDAILSLPAFLSLQDQTTNLPTPSQVGRTDPFSRLFSTSSFSDESAVVVIPDTSEQDENDEEEEDTENEENEENDKILTEEELQDVEFSDN